MEPTAGPTPAAKGLRRNIDRDSEQQRRSVDIAKLVDGDSRATDFEGEITGTLSRSSGLLPVQLDGEIVLYRISENSIDCCHDASKG